MSLDSTQCISYYNLSHCLLPTSDGCTYCEKGYYVQDKSNELCDILIPTCFGGRNIFAGRWEDDLVRFVRPFNLFSGDVIISVKDIGKTIYLVTSKGILDLSTKELIEDTKAFTACLIATNQYFAILRPSMKI